MLEKVHQHIVSELRQGARTDTIFVVTAVVFDLIVLGINSAVAGGAASQRGGWSTIDLILTIFIVMTILVNGIATAALYIWSYASHDSAGQDLSPIPARCQRARPQARPVHVASG